MCPGGFCVFVSATPQVFLNCPVVEHQQNREIKEGSLHEQNACSQTEEGRLLQQT